MKVLFILIFSIALFCECAYCQDAVKHEPRYKPTVHAPAMDTVDQVIPMKPYFQKEMAKILKDASDEDKAHNAKMILLSDRYRHLTRLMYAYEGIDTTAVISEGPKSAQEWQVKVKKLRENAQKTVNPK